MPKNTCLLCMLKEMMKKVESMDEIKKQKHSNGMLLCVLYEFLFV